jgi:hypothetical protein
MLRYQGHRIRIPMHTTRMHHRRMNTRMAIRTPTPIHTRTSISTCTTTIRRILLTYERRLHNHLKARD